eukprot:3305905-Rhodomonas_salina.1
MSAFFLSFFLSFFLLSQRFKVHTFRVQGFGNSGFADSLLSCAASRSQPGSGRALGQYRTSRSTCVARESMYLQGTVQGLERAGSAIRSVSTGQRVARP